MKKFLIQCFIFFGVPFLIILLILGCAELKLSNSRTTFSVKHDYFINNTNKFNLLVLGSSHNQNAINPHYLQDFHSCNLAYGGQDYKIDSALIFNIIDYIPNLKYIILEMSYHSLEHVTSYPSINTLYLRFYNINLFNRKLNLKDYSIYLSDISSYSKIINPFRSKTKINKYGFALELFKESSSESRFKNLRYNENKILKDTTNLFILRHKYSNINNFEKNKITFLEILKLCFKNNVIPIIINPPVYKNYYNMYLTDKQKRKDEFLDKLILENPDILYLNFENDKRFNVKDFKNEDHLNPNGGNKFTKILNDTLRKCLKN